ncbi:hypothetical protein GTP45_10810 [Pseudoduganella sp. FT55W]|uniref:DUF2946 domain-containing protein n=1 Tax=Duganella rivi TaxID=2666083 RepID=A0A7X4GQN0_9BURK|nr:DUF2946 family protein [Duganella rivi]MYM67321.1 hypothetical protein [Duganella rivi]
MTKLLRNRTLSIWIAICAILSFALTPEVLCQVMPRTAMSQNMAICHAQMQSMDTMESMESMESMQAMGEQGKPMAKSHSCCKVCVCNPASSALPSPPYFHPLPPAAHDVLAPQTQATIAAAVHCNKSSPRGPPEQL